MTRIDFYVTGDDNEQARPRIACRLAAKAFSLGRVVHLNAASQSEAVTLDKLLWVFRDGSFVPHALAGDAILDGALGPAPVVVGSGAAPVDACDLLINLGTDVPEFFSRIDRVAEIIDAHPDRRALGRERFRFYRDRGYEIETHKL